jgi:hypothetical protein
MMSSSDFDSVRLSLTPSYSQLMAGTSNVVKLSDLSDVQITDPLLEGQILKLINGKWTNVDPQLLTNNIIEGIVERSGTGYTTTFVIPHGFGSIPSTVFIEGNSQDAEDNFTWSVDATNITIEYVIAPPAGTNNLSFYYRVS